MHVSRYFWSSVIVWYYKGQARSFATEPNTRFCLVCCGGQFPFWSSMTLSPGIHAFGHSLGENTTELWRATQFWDEVIKRPDLCLVCSLLHWPDEARNHVMNRCWVPVADRQSTAANLEADRSLSWAFGWDRPQPTAWLKPHESQREPATPQPGSSPTERYDNVCCFGPLKCY